MKKKIFVLSVFVLAVLAVTVQALPAFPTPPSASYTYWPKVVSSGETVNFYAGTSYDTCGEITRYAWDFGDNTTAEGMNVSHRFALTGNHRVTLTVTDNTGLTAVHSQDVPVPIGAAGAVDNANLSWENGTTEGFMAASAASTLSVTAEKAYAGSNALQWSITAATAGNVEFNRNDAALIPPGSKVVFRIWLPAGAPINWIQPYVMPHNDSWDVTRWFSSWRQYSTLQMDAWNEFSFTLAQDFDPGLQQQIGVQINTSAAGNFTLYVDSVDWPDSALPPYAAFDYAPAKPETGAAVSFDAAGAADSRLAASASAGSIADYAWDFGDGTQAAGAAPVHIYHRPGKYPVTLTVTDNNGLMRSLTRVIWCGPDEPAFAPPLDIRGTDIIDANGRVVTPRGVAIIDNTTYTKEDFTYLKKEWKASIIRMPLITTRWYYASPEAREAYLSLIDQYLDWTYAEGIYVMFDPWHEGGQGDELAEWENCKAAWHIIMQRYAGRSHVLWETFNEPNKTTWEQWAPMAEELIDIIRSYNPVVTACSVPGVVWAQKLDVHTRPVNREKIFYTVHPYPQAYGAQWNTRTWDNEFGYIALEGYAPVFNTEFSFPLFNLGDRENYGEPILKYHETRGMGWLAWIYGGWGGPEKSDPNAYRTDDWQLYWEYLNGIWTPDYNLTVTGGTGSGAYKAGEKVLLKWAKPDLPKGQIALFKGWTGDTEYLRHPAHPVTWLTVPRKDIRLQADYVIIDFKKPKLTRNSCNPGTFLGIAF